MGRARIIRVMVNLQSLSDRSSRGKYRLVLILIFLSLFTLVFALFVYAFLHEGGHALTGLLFGQKLTGFHIDLLTWDAHVGMVGRLTQSQRAMQSIAGAAFPLLIWTVLIYLAPRRTTFSLEVLKLLGSMLVLNTLLPWIVIPLLYIFGKAPPDDVTNFLGYSQMPPVLLSFTAAVLYGRGWVLFLSRINGLRNEFMSFRTTDPKILVAGTRTSVPVMACILAGCIVFTLMLDHSAAGNQLDAFSPPSDFVSVAEIDLSVRAFSEEPLAQFSLDEAAYVGVYIIVRDINTSYFDLRMTGPRGYNSVVLHGEGYRVARDGGLWAKNLPPGLYQLVLTSHQSSGSASIYLKTP